jgi:uncharacterized glyoxalase superfamily protein PhnB
MKNVDVKRLTPVLSVSEVEPCVEFWTSRLGFERTAEVPVDGKLVFAIVKKGEFAVMYQTHASVQDVDAKLREDLSSGKSFLYLDVVSLEDTLAAMKGVTLEIPVHPTFYGAKEFGVRDPGGHLIVFAEFAKN